MRRDHVSVWDRGYIGEFPRSAVLALHPSGNGILIAEPGQPLLWRRWKADR